MVKRQKHVFLAYYYWLDFIRLLTERSFLSETSAVDTDQLMEVWAQIG